jgi:predicted GNAT family acetyltransferase
MEQAELTVRDVASDHKYEIRAGDRVLGIAVYRRRGAVNGAVTDFLHTEVDQDTGYPKVGSTLVRAALDDVRARGGSVIASCPFVRGWIERHQEYADLLARVDS